MTRAVLTTVSFGDRVPDEHLFQTAVVSCDLPPSDEDASAMRDMGAHLGPDAQVQRAPAQMLLQFDGGVTTEWLSRRVAQWTAMIVEHQRQARRARRARGGAPPSEVVH